MPATTKAAVHGTGLRAKHLRLVKPERKRGLIRAMGTLPTVLRRKG